MTEVKVVLNHKYGLHARPSQLLAAMACKFDCDVEILWQGERFDAKSVLDLISLGVPKGGELHLIFNGSDEVDAEREIVDLINRNFDFNE